MKSNFTPTIIIVEDDPEDAIFLTEALQDILHQAEIIHLVNGEQFVDYLEANVLPDIVFLDINLPKKNGFECLEFMKQKSLLDSSSVIMCTTSSSPTHVNKAREFGASHYIVKPFSVDRLHGLVEKTICSLNSEPDVSKVGFLIKD